MKAKALNPRAVAFAERVAGNILRVQSRLAAALNRRTQHWNRASKLLALGCLVLLFGGISLWLIIHALNH